MKCETCDGIGVVQESEIDVMPCPDCNGTGKQPEPIDFIKWMVEKAEDWEMMGKDKRWHLSYLLGDWIDNKSLVYTEVYYPLLLQRAIEGISIGSNSEWLIVQEWSLIRVRTYPKYTKEWKSFDYRAYQSLDQAKESALRYIWEQEQTQ